MKNIVFAFVLCVGLIGCSGNESTQTETGPEPLFSETAASAFLTTSTDVDYIHVELDLSSSTLESYVDDLLADDSDYLSVEVKGSDCSNGTETYRLPLIEITGEMIAAGDLDHNNDFSSVVEDDDQLSEIAFQSDTLESCDAAEIDVYFTNSYWNGGAHHLDETLLAAVTI